MRVRKTKAIFYTDFLRKTTAGRPFWETMGTTRDTIGTAINQAGFWSLPELGFAQGSVQVQAGTRGRVLITATSGAINQRTSIAISRINMPPAIVDE